MSKKAINKCSSTLACIMYDLCVSPQNGKSQNQKVFLKQIHKERGPDWSLYGIVVTIMFHQQRLNSVFVPEQFFKQCTLMDSSGDGAKTIVTIQSLTALRNSAARWSLHSFLRLWFMYLCLF